MGKREWETGSQAGMLRLTSPGHCVLFQVHTWEMGSQAGMLRLTSPGHHITALSPFPPLFEYC
jgi:hypothetical protein